MFCPFCPGSIRVIKNILIEYIITTIVTTYIFRGDRKYQNVSLQLGLPNKPARENNASLIYYAATPKTPPHWRDALEWRVRGQAHE